MLMPAHSHGLTLGAEEFERLVESLWLVGFDLGSNMEKLRGGRALHFSQRDLLQSMLTIPH